MKNRIFKNEDSIIITTFPWHNFNPAIETEVQFMDRMSVGHKNFKSEWKVLSYIDVPIEESPKIDEGNSGKLQEQYYFDGECKDENLKFDEGWNYCLMPSFLINKKHNKKLNDKASDILSLENLDQINLYKINREKEKIKSYTELEWHEQALKNLDDRVLNGEPDKPLIREKLLAKIQELKNKETNAVNPF